MSYTLEQIASWERHFREQRRERFDALCACFGRPLSERVQDNLWNECRGGPVWPLLYRRDFEQWWSRRARGIDGEAVDQPPRIPAVISRLNGDFDIVDGRTAVKMWRELYGHCGRKWLDRKCHGCRGGFGFVYVIAPVEYSGRFKIGKTVDIQKRVRTLSTQAGTQMHALGFTRLCCYDYAGLVENSLHVRYNDRRVLGEWFKGAPEVAEYVAEQLSFLTRRLDVWQRRRYTWQECVTHRISILDKNPSGRFVNPPLFKAC